MNSINIHIDLGGSQAIAGNPGGGEPVQLELYPVLCLLIVLLLSHIYVYVKFSRQKGVALTSSGSYQRAWILQGQTVVFALKTRDIDGHRNRNTRTESDYETLAQFPHLAAEP